MTYNIIRLRFADEEAFLNALQAAIPQLYQPEERDEDDNIITSRGYIESVVTPIYETLTRVRNYGTPEEEVVDTVQGTMTGKRVAILDVIGADAQRPVRDGNGDIVMEDSGQFEEDGVTPIMVPQMETITDFLVNLRTNVDPENDAQLAAAAAFTVTPAHPVKKYVAEVA